MDIKKILTAISEEECIVLVDNNIKSNAVIDTDDSVEIIDGTECVMLQVAPDTRVPIPASNFSEVRVMLKADYMLENMLKAFEGLE